LLLLLLLVLLAQILTLKTLLFCCYCSFMCSGRLQYKYVVRNCDGSVARWQEGPNVALELPGPNLKACAMEVEDSWNQARQVKRIMAAGTPVKFNLQKKCEFGQKLVVVGSCVQLGAWDVTKGLALKWTDGDVWEVSAELPSG
jgi:hypothetical protein